MSTHLDVLAETPLFSAIDEVRLAEIVDASHERELIRGDVLFDADDDADATFVVLSGQIAISMSSEFDGKRNLVALMNPGDLFGELALIDGQPRSAQARALEHTKVLGVPFEPVRQLITTDVELLWHVTKLLSMRLRATDEDLADSMFLDVVGRTAKRLLQLSNGDDTFRMPITQEELAGMVGASRERVNKAIKSLTKLGWIEPIDQGYRFLDREQLEFRSR